MKILGWLADAASRRMGCSLVVGVLAGVAVGWAGWAAGVLVGVAVTGLVFVVLGWLALWPMDAAATQAHVQREDFRPHAYEFVLTSAALCGLAATGGLLVVGGSDAPAWLAAVAVVGVFMSWAALHLMYAARYAYHYYMLEPESIDFNAKEPPTFRDFFYFSYNLGMTYQVSDTSVTTPGLRAIVLRHCLLSYLFGVAILATAVNLVVGALGG